MWNSALSFSFSRSHSFAVVSFVCAFFLLTIDVFPLIFCVGTICICEQQWLVSSSTLDWFSVSKLVYHTCMFHSFPLHLLVNWKNIYVCMCGCVYERVCLNKRINESEYVQSWADDNWKSFIALSKCTRRSGKTPFLEKITQPNRPKNSHAIKEYKHTHYTAWNKSDGD